MLITLGIIGVVAAMTMPALIANYQKKQTVVKLKRFYSIMDQAILRWQQDEGLEPENIIFSSDMIGSGENLQKWFNKTIGQYVQTISQKTQNKMFSAALSDGSGFDAYTSGTNTTFIFYCIDYKYCKVPQDASAADGNFDGKRSFLFTIEYGKLYASLPHQQTYSRQTLLDACKYGNTDDPDVSSYGRRHACTRLIQFDGWEISKDYPWDQTMLEN